MRVCITRPDKAIYSETFIRAHVERLPAEVVGLYGDNLPIFTDAGEALVPWLQRRLNGIVAAARGVPTELVHTIVARAYPITLRERILARHLRKERVDVVLAEFGQAGVGVMGACHRAGVPLVVHFHGLDAYAAHVLEGEGRRYPELFGTAAAIVAVSRDMEQRLLSLGAPREKLFYNPYGVDAALFGEADPAGAPPRFVAIGRFVDKKAPHLTLLAFKTVVERVVGSTLVMVGDGPLLDACRQLSRALGLSEAVRFAGVCSHAEVAGILRSGRAFVQHSLSPGDGDSEGTPVAILEAAASGLPVVSTRHGGIADVVVDGETGILIEERAVGAMADAMLRLAEDPDLAARLGAAGRARVTAEFSMERSITGLTSIIEAAARTGSRPAPSSPGGRF